MKHIEQCKISFRKTITMYGSMAKNSECKIQVVMALLHNSLVMVHLQYEIHFTCPIYNMDNQCLYWIEAQQTALKIISSLKSRLDEKPLGAPHLYFRNKRDDLDEI